MGSNQKIDPSHHPARGDARTSAHRVALTAAIINQTEYPSDADGRFVLWDDKITGLGLRVYPSGKRSFVLLYRARGHLKQRLMTLGSYPSLSLVRAREVAREKLGDISTGSDPLVARKASIQADGFTIAALASVYLERHAKVKKRSWTEDDRRLKAYILPKLGSKSVEAISRGPISLFHSEIGKQSIYEANRSLALLSIMFSCAKKWELVSRDWQNPCEGIEKFKEKSRTRFLREDELPRLVEALKEETIYTQGAIFLFLLTGCRKSELLTAQWENVDLNRRTLLLPQTKSDEPRFIQLSPPAVEMLQRLPRIEGNPFVFPGRKPGSHVFDLNKPWNRIRERSGLKDLRVHDLRRTVGTWLARQGVHPVVIQKSLGHKDFETTLIYTRAVQSEVASALDGHANKLSEFVKL